MADELLAELEERDAEIARLENENHNWKCRANYDPCPNCAETEGMGLSSRNGKIFLYCPACQYSGPEVDRTEPWTQEVDMQAIRAWNAEFCRRQIQLRTKLAAAGEMAKALRSFATPILEGIDELHQRSFRNGCKCSHCGARHALAAWEKVKP